VKIVRIVLIIIGIAATICCLYMGKYALAAFNFAVALMNFHYLFEEWR
jgi:uncharacterized membrane protein YuzA (DUF378 family)